MRTGTSPNFILCGVALLLTACGTTGRDMHTHLPSTPAEEIVLFQDSMEENWEQNWFVDGDKAELSHRDGGLLFHAPDSGVAAADKNTYRERFDAHHAVLWTRQEFEGDIRIRYEWHPIQTGWANLVYVQAQGIGTGPYAQDIFAWRDLRKVSSMDMYFNHMNLLSLSLRGEIRCRRYPWNDVDRGIKLEDNLVEPMAPHAGLEDGKRYRISIEKRMRSCRLVIHEVDSGSQVIDFTWDLSTPSPDRKTPYVNKGRIGLRQMGGNQVVLRDFTVTRLLAD